MATDPTPKPSPMIASQSGASVDTGDPTDVGMLPTFEAPARTPRLRDHGEILARLEAGQRLAQFQLVRELGSGAFGRVFLARDVPLDRLVALKATVAHSGEARALARLEHDHIVRVFTAETDPVSGLRLLSMQYIPGTTLDRVGKRLAELSTSWNGRTFLETAESLGGDAVVMEPFGRRDAEVLSTADQVASVCWIGARLAEALDHAHRQGVLHRDIKPSNILVHRNGRVLFTDFNLAADPRRTGGQIDSSIPALFGGTPAYMAPEHMDALNSSDESLQEKVDVRSDVYSLGIVLFELLTGQRPFRAAPEGVPATEALGAMATERRQIAPAPRQVCPQMPLTVDRVIQRCLEPEPQRRYPTAGTLAQVLDGCRELQEMDRPASAGSFTRFARKQPAMMAAILPIVPHLCGALLVIAYATVWVSSHPARPALEPIFLRLGLWYSLVAFPVTGIISYFLTRSIWQTYQALQTTRLVEPAIATRARHRVMRKPHWGAMLSGLGWLPGAVLLPILVRYLSPEAASWDVLLQCSLWFVIAGLIALTYTEFADQFLLLHVAYPALWVDPITPRQTARTELRDVGRRLWTAQVLSGLVPLATGFALMAGLISASPEQRASSGFLIFLVLVTALIALGLISAWFAVLISDRLNRTVATLNGANEL